MKRYIFPIVSGAMLLGLAICCGILGRECSRMRQDLIRQDMILLKQTEILAVNTAIIRGVLSAGTNPKASADKEVFTMDRMP